MLGYEFKYFTVYTEFEYFTVQSRASVQVYLCEMRLKIMILWLVLLVETDYFTSFLEVDRL